MHAAEVVSTPYFDSKKNYNYKMKKEKEDGKTIPTIYCRQSKHKLLLLLLVICRSKSLYWVFGKTFSLNTIHIVCQSSPYSQNETFQPKQDFAHRETAV